MDYKINELQLKNPQEQGALEKLFNEKGIVKKILSQSSEIHEGNEKPAHSSLFLGGFEGNQLIGFCAFLPKFLIFKGKFIKAYQCMWVHLSPERDPQIVLPLINRGIHQIKEKNPSLIFTILRKPFATLFNHELKFENKGCFYEKTLFPLKGLKKPSFNKNSFPFGKAAEIGIYQNNLDLIKTFKRSLGENLLVHEHCSNSSVWGRMITKSFLYWPIKVFKIGGLNVNNPYLFHDLLRELFQRFKVSFIHFSYHETSCFRFLLRNASPPPHGSSLLWLPFHGETKEIQTYNFSSGLMGETF